jgi:hypothetical protein
MQLSHTYFIFLNIINLTPFQGGSLGNRFPGVKTRVKTRLKPRAESCCPFGTRTPGRVLLCGLDKNPRAESQLQDRLRELAALNKERLMPVKPKK